MIHVLVHDEAANDGWNSLGLDRNIGTQYYYRLLKARKSEGIEKKLENRKKFQEVI